MRFENTGMDTILPLPAIGQYKQKTRGCHASFPAATEFPYSSWFLRTQATQRYLPGSLENRVTFGGFGLGLLRFPTKNK
jgi:hypothetical protein